MAGLYIHIPFCKQACFYCDFHFSTSLKRKPELVNAICKELILRKDEAESIETIYFGGGTPSLLSVSELEQIFKVINDYYKVSNNAEITLEANPDDLSENKIKTLSDSPINRLSIGIQSFFEEDLVWMNRSHSAAQAIQSIETAKAYFGNISIDLIYGVPGMEDEKWKSNLSKALSFEIPHISSYALTVEPNTALAKMIKLGKKKNVDDERANRHYKILVNTLTAAGYINYEFSNFGKEGFFSKNNTAYWIGTPYIGIGPSAHGFDGTHRYWNVRHNIKYANAVNEGVLPSKQETLTLKDRYNEYIMTGLRTIWGISLNKVKKDFGAPFHEFLLKEAKPLLDQNLLLKEGDTIKITPDAKFLGDGISSDLFYVE